MILAKLPKDSADSSLERFSATGDTQRLETGSPFFKFNDSPAGVGVALSSLLSGKSHQNGHNTVQGRPFSFNDKPAGDRV